MTGPVLAPCPFCKAPMRVESNRDWHRIVGDHDDQCFLTDRDTVMVPATDEQLALAVRDWNRCAPAQGMTMRDEFAARALQGLAAHFNGAKERSGETGAQANARVAYAYADAMLVEREKGQ